MEEYCLKHPNVKMQFYRGGPYRGTFCPVCEAEAEKQKLLAEQQQEIVEMQAHQNYLLEKRLEEERSRTAEIRRNELNDRDALYLRTGILEFDDGYQKKWEECIREGKRLSKELTDTRKVLNEENKVSLAFQRKYKIDGCNKYSNDIAKILDAKYKFGQHIEVLKEKCDRLNEGTTKLRAFFLAHKCRYCQINVPVNLIEALGETRRHVMSIGPSGPVLGEFEDRLNFDTNYKPKRRWLIWFAVVSILGLQCNSMCGDSLLDTSNNSAMFFLGVSVIFLIKYGCQLAHKKNNDSKMRKIDSLLRLRLRMVDEYRACILSIFGMSEEEVNQLPKANRVRLINSLDEFEIVPGLDYCRILGNSYPPVVRFGETARALYGVIEPQYWAEVIRRSVKPDSNCSLGRKIYEFSRKRNPSKVYDELNIEHKKIVQYRNFMRDTVMKVGKEVHNGERVPSNRKSRLISVTNCPSCGGPLPVDHSKVCHYCGSTLRY